VTPNKLIALAVVFVFLWVAQSIPYFPCCNEVMDFMRATSMSPVGWRHRPVAYSRIASTSGHGRKEAEEENRKETPLLRIRYTPTARLRFWAVAKFLTNSLVRVHVPKDSNGNGFLRGRRTWPWRDCFDLA